MQKAKILGVETSAILVLAMFAATIPAFSQVGIEVNQEQLENCVLEDGNTDFATHVSMSTVISGKIVKTTHAEKQIFNCDFQGVIQDPVDVTIISEVYEDIEDKEVIATNVLVITCAKQEAVADLVNCFSYLPSSGSQAVGTACYSVPVDHPQEQTSVQKNRKVGIPPIVVEKIVKTTITQKEVFYCPLTDGSDEGSNPDDKKVDIVMFEDIYQDMLTMEVTKVTTMDMRCIFKVESALVESCQRGAEQDITPI